MLIYWINLFTIPLWALLFKVLKYKNKIAFLSIIFIQCYLILCLRNTIVGADTLTYLKLFEILKQYSFWEFDITRHEVGYIFLNKILSFVDSNQIFLAIISFIPLVLIFRFIYIESKIVWLSVFLFIILGFYTNLFNLFRQVIAIGIICISYSYLNNGSNKKFLFTTILASLFHTTAIVFVAVYFLRNIKVNGKSLFIFTVIGLSMYFAANPIITFLLNTFSTLDYEIGGSGGLSLLAFYISILVIAYLIKDELLKDKSNLLLFHILIISILIQTLALEFSLMTRLTRYFSIFLIIFIPNIILALKNKYLMFSALYFFMCFGVWFYYTSLIKDHSALVPYLFFWGK